MARRCERGGVVLVGAAVWARRCGVGGRRRFWSGVVGGDIGTCVGRGGVLVVSPPRRVPRRLCSSRCWTAGWVVVTALVCGVEHALFGWRAVPVSPRLVLLVPAQHLHLGASLHFRRCGVVVGAGWRTGRGGSSRLQASGWGGEGGRVGGCAEAIYG